MRFWPVTLTRLSFTFKRDRRCLRHVDVIALDAHVGAGRGEGREVGEDADIDGAGLGDVVDRIGIGLGGETKAGRPSISTAAMDDLSFM